MKKRGFTLVELLGVIVVLAIITLLAVSGYGKVSKNVKEKSYNNLISYIETKASEYANDTGNLLTNVDALVKLGYIEADDEEGNVKSPIDGSRLNCHIVSIIKEDNSLYGEYSEEEECNLDNLVIKNQNLGINVYETNDNVTKGAKLEENAWANKNVILEVYVGEKINANDIKKIIWQSNIGKEEININEDFYSKNTYLVEAEQIVNTTYSATIILNDDTSYQVQTDVKIDKQRPVIYKVFIERENEHTSQDKKVTITASDGNGSGIYGYYVGTNPNCNEVEYELNNSSSFETYKDNGTYYVCVKDNAGNVSEDVSTKKFEIKYIDKTPPKIVAKQNPLTLGNEDYDFANNVSVTWGNSGTGKISCNPTISKKSGVYNVTCTAISNSGLSDSVAFEVKHNYPAVKSTCEEDVPKCKYECKEWRKHDNNGNDVGSCGGDNSYCTCEYGGTVCDAKKYGTKTVTYTCYLCPYGGTLNASNNICYY